MNWHDHWQRLRAADPKPDDPSDVRWAWAALILSQLLWVALLWWVS